MYTVFLAGGMASGKSTVARMLEEKGAYRIDLDCISRDVLAPGSGCVQEIVRAFGEDVVDQKTGRLNRHQLAMRAFATPTTAKKLEAIEMPYIIRTLKETLVEVSLKEDAPAVCVVEVPLLDRIESLLMLADEVVAVVSPYELRKKRAQLRGVSLKDFEQLDETRFYQEVAYFVEKLDISEEKVRLTQHLKYFLEVLNNEDFNGKKLGFISQEIGREINTLGSKANHHEIQKIVVMMKDNLEKIKEQTLNVL